MNLTRGRQRVRRDRSKAYREIAKRKQTADNQRRTIEKYRKRLYRRSQRTNDLDSPRTKTDSMLRGQRVSMPVKKTLLFHHVLVKGVTEKYKLMKSERSKQLLAQAFCNKLLKKYRMKKATKQHLNMTQRRIKEPISSDVGYVRKPRKISIIERLKSDIEQFLCRIDNSRLKAGKKSTKTSAKVKKQIYLLNDTLRNLHLKYLAEDTSRRLSYSLFCRLKPFYIRHATAADSETCLCKRHENLQFKINKLKQLKVINSNDLDDLTTGITCCNDSIECMYRTCKDCSLRKVEIGDYEQGKMVKWFEWRTKKIEKLQSSGEERCSDTRVVSFTVKVCEKGVRIGRVVTSRYRP